MTSQPPIEIGVREVQELLDSGQVVLIDCREPAEWEMARISGAKLLPMSQWAEVVPQLDQVIFDSTKAGSSLDSDPNTNAAPRIVVHCHHGGRSLRVVQWMRENGYPDAQNMTGGIHAWSCEVDSSIPQY